MQIRYYCRAMTGARVVVRDATEADLDASVELIAAHRGGDVDEWRRLFANALHDGKRHFVVALVDARVIGFGHTKLVERDASRHSEGAPPPGWYLSGVTVEPDYRRLGVGTALTRVRLDRLRGKTDFVYYAAESENIATLELHSLFGFSPTGRLVHVPGAERPLTLHRRCSDGRCSSAHVPIAEPPAGSDVDLQNGASVRSLGAPREQASSRCERPPDPRPAVPLSARTRRSRDARKTPEPGT